MKKSKRIKSYRRYLAKKARKALKRRRLIKRRKKHLRRLLQGKPRSQKKNIESKFRAYVATAPENFSLLTNTEETINFLNKIEACFNKSKEVFVKLRDVINVDHSATTVLLSLMYKFKIARITFNGDFPEDEKARQIINDSQFFDKLLTPLSSGMSEDYTLRKDSQIFARANTVVVSEMGESIMEESSKTIWGERRVCKGLQRTLIELMHNTNNHASENANGQEHWWISVNHDKERQKVDFYFVDYGQGILKSLERKSNPKIWSKFLSKVKTMIELGSGPDIIKALLKGEHWTPRQRVQPYYRGKGLPSIKDALDRKQISNLHIITNNTYSNVSTAQYRHLSKDFNGTFIHWELGVDNVNEVWNL